MSSPTTSPSVTRAPFGDCTNAPADAAVHGQVGKTVAVDATSDDEPVAPAMPEDHAEENLTAANCVTPLLPGSPAADVESSTLVQNGPQAAAYHAAVAEAELVLRRDYFWAAFTVWWLVLTFGAPTNVKYCVFTQWEIDGSWATAMYENGPARAPPPEDDRGEDDDDEIGPFPDPQLEVGYWARYFWQHHYWWYYRGHCADFPAAPFADAVEWDVVEPDAGASDSDEELQIPEEDREAAAYYGDSAKEYYARLNSCRHGEGDDAQIDLAGDDADEDPLEYGSDAEDSSEYVSDAEDSLEYDSGTENTLEYVSNGEEHSEASAQSPLRFDSPF